MNPVLGLACGLFDLSCFSAFSQLILSLQIKQAVTTAADLDTPLTQCTSTLPLFCICQSMASMHWQKMHSMFQVWASFAKKDIQATSLRNLFMQQSAATLITKVMLFFFSYWRLQAAFQPEMKRPSITFWQEKSAQFIIYSAASYYYSSICGVLSRFPQRRAKLCYNYFSKSSITNQLPSYQLCSSMIPCCLIQVISTSKGFSKSLFGLILKGLLGWIYSSLGVYLNLNFDQYGIFEFIGSANAAFFSCFGYNLQNIITFFLSNAASNCTLPGISPSFVDTANKSQCCTLFFSTYMPLKTHPNRCWPPLFKRPSTSKAKPRAVIETGGLTHFPLKIYRSALQFSSQLGRNVRVMVNRAVDKDYTARLSVDCRVAQKYIGSGWLCCCSGSLLVSNTTQASVEIKLNAESPHNLQESSSNSNVTGSYCIPAPLSQTRHTFKWCLVYSGAAGCLRVRMPSKCTPTKSLRVDDLESTAKQLPIIRTIHKLRQGWQKGQLWF